MTSEQPALYHERQRLQMCGLHALNCLFQEPKFNKSKLDSIVHEYDKSRFFNEYSTLFTGNYDLRIIMEALRRSGYVLQAIDSSQSFDTFNYRNCLGLLLNVQVDQSIYERIPIVSSFVKRGRHWLSIKSVDGERFYDFDSRLTQPKLIGDRDALVNYLNQLDREHSYIYLVIDEKLSDNFK